MGGAWGAFLYRYGGVVSYRGTCSTRFKVNARMGMGEDAGGLKKRGKVGERIEESAGAADLKARIYLTTE